MRQFLAFALAGFVLGLANPVAAQETDDWEFGENSTTGVSAAVTRYDSGHAFVVQCRAGELTVVVSGLAAGEADTRDLDLSRSDGRRDHQTWKREGDAVLQAQTPGRAARLIRGGGVIQLRSAGGEPVIRAGFDLPAQSDNLNRVLTACGRSLTDDRDTRPVFAGTLDRQSLTRAYNRSVTTPGTQVPAAAEVSCIVGEDLRLQDCKVEQAVPVGSLYGIEMAERLTGVVVDPASTQSAPGSVYYWSRSNMLEVVVDYVAQ